MNKKMSNNTIYTSLKGGWTRKLFYGVLLMRGLLLPSISFLGRESSHLVPVGDDIIITGHLPP